MYEYSFGEADFLQRPINISIIATPKITSVLESMILECRLR